MLTQAQRVSIRRHCGLPTAGSAQAGRILGWRFMIAVTDLEYRMSNMSPNEEQYITGRAAGSWNIGDRPTAGDVLTFTIVDGNGTHTVTYTVTSQDVNPPPSAVNPAQAAPTFSIALNAANALNRTSYLQTAGYSAVAAMPADLFDPQYMPPYFAEVIITGPNPTLFTIGAAVTGTTSFIVGAQVSPSPIQATLFGPNGATVYGYCQLLDTLAMGMPRAELSLWLQKADQSSGVDFRNDEVKARRALYRHYVDDMLKFMGGEEYVDAFFAKKGGRGGVVA